MNLENNLRNAVSVLRDTYVNIEKLARFLQDKAQENGFVCMTNDILMWQSKRNTYGWVTSKFTLVFQHADSPLFENGWRDDDIYGVEISFESDDEMCLYVSKFHYSMGLRDWRPGCKPSDDWGFTHPKWNHGKFNIVKQDGLIVSTPRSAKESREYWGIDYAVYKGETLFDLTADNVNEKIFSVMKELSGFKI